MRILALDTALAACSAALWEDGRIVAHRWERMPRGQSEALVPMIGAVMTEAGTGYADLDRIAVTRGPGAFTGLRIGLATARGLALAADLPCVGVTTLEAVAAAVPTSERTDRVVLVALDSRRGDLFVQLFAGTLDPLCAPCAVAPEDLPALIPEGNRVVVVGDGAERALQTGFDALRSDALGLPDATHVAAVAARYPTPDTPPAPLYLRAPNVTVSANTGALRPRA